MVVYPLKSVTCDENPGIDKHASLSDLINLRSSAFICGSISYYFSKKLYPLLIPLTLYHQAAKGSFILFPIMLFASFTVNRCNFRIRCFFNNWKTLTFAGLYENIFRDKRQKLAPYLFCEFVDNISHSGRRGIAYYTVKCHLKSRKPLQMLFAAYRGIYSPEVST